MRVVFIAAPYQVADKREREQLIRRALEATVSAWNLGGAPVCPSLSVLGLGEAVSRSTAAAGGLELLRRSDSVMVVAGEDDDVRQELQEARRLSLPVFDAADLPGLKALLADGGTRERDAPGLAKARTKNPEEVGR
ncbi:MAG: hypothetical protein ACK2T6_04935 [Anaerolineae bacterium]